MTVHTTLRSVLILSVLLLLPAIAHCQGLGDDGFRPQLGFGNQFGADASARGDIQLSASFTLERGTTLGELKVTGVVSEGWHTYAIDQAAGGPNPSKISMVDRNRGIRLLSSFAPSVAPHIVQYDSWPGLDVREIEGTVVWTAPVEVPKGYDPRTPLRIHYVGQICSVQGVCVEIDREFTADFGGYTDPPNAVREDDSAGVTVRGTFSPRVVKPGSTAQLKISLEPVDQSFHIYRWHASVGNFGNKPTIVGLSLPEGWTASDPVPTTKTVGEVDGLEYHEGPAEWTIEVSVADDAELGQFVITGGVGYQACSTQQCKFPSGSSLRIVGEVAAVSQPDSIPVLWAASDYSKVAAALPFQVDAPNASLLWVLGVALLGGFVLNFMPCVLPVIGLKIMAFVEQAGQSRFRVFTLNLWYSLGLASVFWVLAGLSIGAGFLWGEQSSIAQFNVVMAAVVFAMALSFLGVWEIPIPGFATGKAASELASQEGAVGAFSKGIVTTLLAVPCTGPGLANATAWCQNKPAGITILVFTFLALGMAAPYLLIGAVPSLVRLLPRPGAWMETFKHAMGFVLLGTVVWLLNSIGRPEWMIPTLVLLAALAVACWWVGRTPGTAEPRIRRRAWLQASAFAALIGVAVFSRTFDQLVANSEAKRLFSQWAIPLLTISASLWAALWWALRSPASMSRSRRLLAQLQGGAFAALMAWVSFSVMMGPHLDWDAFGEDRLRSELADGNTVMVDFTAGWCVNCKIVEGQVLATKKSLAAIEELGIVPLVADFTDGSPEIKHMLKALRQDGIPVLAIFPADRPNEPIVLSGVYTRATYFAALEAATGIAPGSSDGQVAIGARR